MLPLPKKYFVTAAAAEGETRLTAFDGALLAARVEIPTCYGLAVFYLQVVNMNLISNPPGSLLPIAYGSITSSEPGELISAAVAVGIQAEGFGVIMEFSGRCSKERLKPKLPLWLKKLFAYGNWNYVR